MNYLSGIPIVINNMLPATMPVSVRKHKDRGELRTHRFFKHVRCRPSAYHKRIQKKWDKRYGMKEQPYYLLMHGRYFMHQDVYAQIKAMIDGMEKDFLQGTSKLQPRDGGILGKRATGVIIDDL